MTQRPKRPNAPGRPSTGGLPGAGAGARSRDVGAGAPSTRPRTARDIALDALDRIDPGGAYANLLLPEVLGRSGLEPRDRHFVTELVYGTTRMRRACDLLIDRFLTRDLEPRVRNALRLGAYQLHFLSLAPHAAVGETVEAAPKAARGLVNAVLRRVADNPVVWPDDATRLSYPDWVVEVLTADLGAEAALGALELMNTAPTVTERDDGYVQDLASQWVAEAVGAQPGERVADLCAAPGGKATLLAATGAHVVAADIRKTRVNLIQANARAAWPMSIVAADAAQPPFGRDCFDRVLIDAPCSGLGTLRRRPDARWKIDAAAPARLAAVQRGMVDEAAALVRPGGRLVYSVCTLTDLEGPGIDEHLAATRPDFVAEPFPDGPWQPLARGARLLPQTAGTDGMYLLRLRRGQAN
ncbi:MAG: transcription antitermination factor NusB [Acidimicrobiales bacterium]